MWYQGWAWIRNGVNGAQGAGKRRTFGGNGKTPVDYIATRRGAGCAGLRYKTDRALWQWLVVKRHRTLRRLS